MTTKINITEYKDINKGALKAKFSLHLPDIHMMIRDCTHMQSNAKEWIGFPSRIYEQDGQKKYFSFIVIEKSVRDSFNHAVLEAIKALKPQVEEVYNEPQPTSFDGLQSEDVPF